jgi:hypothetical protein
MFFMPAAQPREGLALLRVLARYKKVINLREYKEFANMCPRKKDSRLTL